MKEKRAIPENKQENDLTCLSFFRDEMNYYISSENITGALLITGKWGSGKTYMLESFKASNQDKYAIKRVSLFGMSDVGQMHNAVKESYLSCVLGKFGSKVRRFQKKANKLIDDTANIVLSLPMGIVQNTAMKGAKTVLTYDFFDHIEVGNTVQSQEGTIPFVLVFDDFERCQIPIELRIGIINHYVENERIKTIIIADEEKIHENQEYREFKEKVVSRTVRIKSDSRDVISYIISSSNLRNDYRDFVEKWKEEFLSAFNDSGYMNYRAFKCCLYDFERIYRTWHEKSGEADDEIQSFIYEFCARVYESKAGKYVKALSNDYYTFADYSEDDQGESHSPTKDKYRHGTFTWDFHSISKWLVDGEWNEEQFKYELLKKYAFSIKTPEDRILLSMTWGLEQADIDQGLPVILRKSYDGELSRDELICLLNTLTFLNSQKVKLPCEISYKKILDGLNKRLARIKAGDIDEPEIHRFIENSQLDKEAVPINNLIKQVENYMIVWKNRNLFISFINGNVNIRRNEIRNQYFEEFDKEMLEAFESRFMKENNENRFTLTRVLHDCIFDFSEYSREENIQTTISNFTTLIEDLQKYIAECERDMTYIVVEEAINTFKEKREELEQRKKN